MPLTNLVYRSPTRIRLLFSAALGSGAFTPAKYVVTNQDAKGVDPAVSAALVVGDTPEAVELVLHNDLVSDALYQVAALSIPYASGPPDPPEQDFAFRTPGAPSAAPSPTVAVDDVLALIYGADIVWSGQDFVETSEGDLARLSGPENARLAGERRITSDGLKWDPTYGAKPRQYVDGTPGAVGDLRGAIERQLLLDDRYKRAKATFVPQDDTATVAIEVQSVLVGDVGVTVQTDVPIGGGNLQ